MSLHIDTYFHLTQDACLEETLMGEVLRLKKERDALLESLASIKEEKAVAELVLQTKPPEFVEEESSESEHEMMEAGMDESPKRSSKNRGGDSSNESSLEKVKRKSLQHLDD